MNRKWTIALHDGTTIVVHGAHLTIEHEHCCVPFSAQCPPADAYVHLVNQHSTRWSPPVRYVACEPTDA